MNGQTIKEIVTIHEAEEIVSIIDRLKSKRFWLTIGAIIGSILFWRLAEVDDESVFVLWAVIIVAYLVCETIRPSTVIIHEK